MHVICLRFLILYFLFWPTKFRLLLNGSPGSSSAYFSQLEKNVDLRFFFKSVFKFFDFDWISIDPFFDWDFLNGPPPNPWLKKITREKNFAIIHLIKIGAAHSIASKEVDFDSIKSIFVIRWCVDRNFEQIFKKFSFRFWFVFRFFVLSRFIGGVFFGWTLRISRILVERIGKIRNSSNWWLQ